MTPTPEGERVDARSVAEYNPAIALLRKTLSSGKDAEDAFRKWRSNPMTRLFADAIAELADSPHPGLDRYACPEQALVQYGMTSGLSLAHRLLTQPSRVYPDIFRGDVPVQDEYPLDRGYDDNDTADAVIDRI